MSTLEFDVAPADAALLLSTLTRVGRASAVEMLWHDTPAGLLADDTRTLCQAQGVWRIEALGPVAGSWPPASPTPILAEAASPRLLDLDPGAVVPIAAFTGHRRRFTGPAPVSIAVLSGALRGVAAEQAVCRVTLDGPAEMLPAVAAGMAGRARLSVPRAGLGASAIAVARGQVPVPRHLGAPAVRPGQVLSDSIALIIGQLLDVMLHWSEPAAAGATPTGVHQMRVATRRLRSALSICKGVAPCDAAIGPALRELATVLGAARDWDVFLGGTGAEIRDAFPDDRRVRTMLAAAARQRAAAYDRLRAYLASPAFRMLEIALGCTASLRPWDTLDAALPEGQNEPGPLQQDTALFASAVLNRRHRQVRRAGRGIRTLPIEALHALRKDCKRLRYAAEFFQALYSDKPGRRYVRALAALQEELGMLNDGAVAAGLMAHLGRTERGYAAGLVGGFVAGHAGQLRTGIGAAWDRFRRVPEFWTGA